MVPRKSPKTPPAASKGRKTAAAAKSSVSRATGSATSQTEEAAGGVVLLCEPYEQYLYSELRKEISVRSISVKRQGPQRVTTRASFIATLQEWDKVHGRVSSGGKKTGSRAAATATATAATHRGMNSWVTRGGASSATSGPSPRGTVRVVRARRGCRFRLINVLLSPDFNTRWNEMVSTGEMEAKKFWSDVHAAYMAQSSMLDTLHFQDALFVNVTPNVILPHTAARLMQIWVEVATMYRNAVSTAKQATSNGDTAHSFFDFCAGRLDLLYLHMAMLLEPELYGFVMGKKIPVTDPFSRNGPKTKTNHPAPAAAMGGATASKSSVSAKAGKTGAAPVGTAAAAFQAHSGDGGSQTMVEAPKAASQAANMVQSPDNSMTTPAKRAAGKGKAPASNRPKVSGIPTQNPEMTEAQAAIRSSPPNSVPQAVQNAASGKASAAVGANKAGDNEKTTKRPVGRPRKNPVQKNVPRKTSGKTSKAAGAAGSESSGKREVTVSAKRAAEPTDKKAPSGSAQAPSPSVAGDGSVSSDYDAGAETRTSGVTGKRPQEETMSSAIVEVPSVRGEIIPHPAKRVRTTTISTALTTRPSELMLPPDEWDILEHRLRKVNEDIGRCHRALAGVEASASGPYKQTLENDLHFYSAIKQRLQEQLLVVMQSGY
ncbi:hypothetical protein BBJ28_00021798 [Nothophytophthora sp. Chile5]|nr:hypothetical protein BBJ28_00021798 [Nothophytophthora sp. Chile5]